MSIQQIEVSAGSTFTEKLKLITVHSSSLKGRGTISCYNATSTRKEIPIVFLLHGVYGGHWVWMDLGRAHQVYERLLNAHDINEMLLVMPDDGGYFAGSGYLPLSNGLNFEKWIMEDALASVIRAVECVSEASSVYLSGLSMGGYGALRLGAKYANRVSGISAHSAMTSIDDFKHFVKEDLSIYECHDPNEANLIHWFEKHKRHLPPLRLDCGTEDVLFESNLKLVNALNKAGISHQFEQHDGGHQWTYWNRHLATTLQFFDHLERTLAA